MTLEKLAQEAKKDLEYVVVLFFLSKEINRVSILCVNRVIKENLVIRVLQECQVLKNA